MLHKFRLSLCLTITFLAFLISKEALSASENSVTYNGGTMVVVNQEDVQGLLPRDFYGVRPIRDKIAPDTFLKLRFYSIGEVTGCITKNDYMILANTGKKSKGKEDVNVRDSELSLNKKKHRYGNYDCSIEREESYFDVPLDVRELKKKNISSINVRSSKYGSFMDFKVDTSQSDRLIFSSEYPAAPGMPKTSVKMIYWLYPINTVILFAPTAKDNQDVTPQLIELGLKKGLTPLDQVMDFELSPNEKNYYYFVDEGRQYRPLIFTEGDSTILGQVQATRTMYGANGPVEEPYMIDVHITVPGGDN